MDNINLTDARKGAFPEEWKKCVVRREIIGGYTYGVPGLSLALGHGGAPILVRAWVSFLNSDGESGDDYPLRDLSVLVRLLDGSLKTGDAVNVRFHLSEYGEEVMGMVRPPCLRCPNKHMGYRKKPRKVRKRRRWVGRKAFMSPIWRYIKRDA